jgi:hypothetical protein
MALVVADRVKETTTSVGTSTVNLAGAEDNFESFVTGVGSGNTTYYAIVDKGNSEFEVGIGTVTSGTPDTLSRDTVLASSNSDALVNFSSGSKDVFCTQPAEKAVYLDSSGQLVIDGTAVTATAAELNYVDGVTSNIQTQLDSKLNLSGGTMTGALTLSGAPTADNHATTKIYVDELIAAGIHYHDPVRVESPDSAGSLTATYDNGTSGVGATLTNNGTQAALVIDDVTLNTNDRVLIYNQTNAFENGIYTVTNTGSASTNWVLTRATDADSYGVDNQSLSEGTSIFVLEGTDGSGEVYACTTTGTITFGTTAINFSQIGKSAVITGNGGITVTGNQVGANVDATVQTTAANSVTSTSSRTYAVQVDAGNDLVVNVPWVDTDTNTDTTYTAGTGLTLSGTQFSVTDNYVLNTGDAIAGQLSITDSVWPPLSVTRDAGAVTTGNYGALKLNTSTTGTPAAGLGSYAAFYVDDVIKGAVGFENDGSFHVTDGGSTERLVIDGSGKVGIGTPGPSVELSIAGSDPQLVLWEGTDGASSSKVQLGTGAVQGFVNIHKGDGTRTVQLNSDGDTYFNGGSVGVGTSPDTTFHVLGNNLVSIMAGSHASSTYHQYRYNTSTVSGYIGNGSSILSGANNSDFIVRSQADLVFASNGNSRTMTLDTAGNVGIGVTPSAWRTSSDEKVLQIDTVSLYGNNANNSYLNNNWYLNSSSQSIYIESDFATSFASEDGKFVWYQTGSGTAGNTISWTSAMTLDASGNLLVGKTSPSFGTDGIEIRADDSLYVTRSDTTAFFNRKSTDGDIVKFYKDNSTVGSIGTQGGTLEVGSGDVYLQFNGTNDWIKPVDGSGSNKPNVDLGTSGAKFKDLHLSGTAYIGGNAALTTADEGSGNGLDADTVDGVQANKFFTSYNNAGTTGWEDSNRNFRINSGGTAAGFAMHESDGTFAFNVYGDGSAYGFLASNWGAWDIQKTINGQFKVDEGSGLQRVYNDAYHPQADNADTVDGLQASQFLRSDANDSTSGTLTVQTLSVGTNTVTTTSDIALSANVAINAENSLSFGMTNGTTGYYRWMFGNTSKTGGTAGGTEKMRLDKDGDLSLSGSVTTPSLFVGDGTDGEFYSDAAGRTAFRNGDFYLQTSVGNFYCYATNMYLGNTSGDNVYLRGNPMSGNGWSLTGAGVLQLAPDTTDVLNFTANSTNDSRGISFNSRTALSADYNDGFLRLNNASEFSNGTYSPLNIRSDADLIANTNVIAGATSAPTGAGQVALVGTSSVSTAPFLSFHENSTSRRFYIQYNISGNYPVFHNEEGDQFRFYTNGNVTSIPLYSNGSSLRGYIYANSSNQIGFLDSDGNWAIQHTRDSATRFNVNNVEKFVIGASSTTSANDITVNSDERIKDNVELIPNALEKVQAIRGVTFNRTDTDDDTRHAGVIAQEVEKVLPEVVTENEETGIKSVAYANMVGLLIEAVKEQQTQIDDLKAEVTRLKGFE